jgi:hypothetical protein
MACKQGIRKSMDQSREFYEKLKEYDPFSELWKSLVNRSVNDPKLESFSTAERLYFATCLFEGEVLNGGFDQYFYNSSGNFFTDAQAGLKEIGATHSSQLLEQAVTAAFGSDRPPTDRVERWNLMRARPDCSQRLNELDRQFYEDSDDLFGRLRAYAENQRLIERFIQ